MIKGAKISSCGTYRYALWRTWNPSLPSVMFIGLNPSTADDKKDDRTITRCINYAKSWGYGGVSVGNLFALRSIYPKDLKMSGDPVGPDNDEWLLRLANNASEVIAVWGNHGRYLCRDIKVMQMFPNLRCLKLTAAACPHHPRGLSSDLRPVLLSDQVAQVGRP